MGCRTPYRHLIIHVIRDFQGDRGGIGKVFEEIIAENSENSMKNKKIHRFKKLSESKQEA